jgi:hypothetical protein
MLYLCNHKFLNIISCGIKNKCNKYRKLSDKGKSINCSKFIKLKNYSNPKNKFIEFYLEEIITSNMKYYYFIIYDKKKNKNIFKFLLSFNYRPYIIYCKYDTILNIIDIAYYLKYLAKTFNYYIYKNYDYKIKILENKYKILQTYNNIDLFDF